MSNTPVRAAITALVLGGFGAAVQAAPSFHAPLASAVSAICQDQQSQDASQQDPDNKERFNWALPSVIQSGLIQRGGSIFFGDSYASLSGRSFEQKQILANVGLADWIEVYYGRQFALAKGHSSTSRFHVADDEFGARVVVKRPTATDPSSLSLQYTGFSPDTADATISGSEELLNGTHNNFFAANYGDKRQNQYQLSYTKVSTAAGYDANVYGLGYGRDFELGDSFTARLQGHVILQSFNGPADHSNYELRTILYGAIAYNPTGWLRFEADVTAMPGGMPFAGSEFTGVSSFAVYEPGGIVNDLRHDFVAYGSVRLVFHGSF